MPITETTPTPEAEETRPTCEACNEIVSEDDEVCYDDCIYHHDCFTEFGFFCNQCSEAHHNDCSYDKGFITSEGLSDSDCTICEACANELLYCEPCGKYFRGRDVIESEDIHVCLSCATEEFDENIHTGDLFMAIRNHQYCAVLTERYNEVYHEESEEQEERLGVGLNTTTKKYQSQEVGKIIKDFRGFSAEIECYDTSGKVNNIRDNIARSFGGTGLTHDQSLNQNGIELQTPILAGKAGEVYLHNLVDMLKGQGCTIDKKAGLHIHLDGNGFSIHSLFTPQELLTIQAGFFFDLENKGAITKGDVSARLVQLREFVRQPNDELWATYPSGQLSGVSDVLHAKYPNRAKERKLVDIKYLKNRSRFEKSIPKIKNLIKEIEQRLGKDQREAYQVFMSNLTSEKLLPKIKNLFTAYYFADDFLMQVIPHSRRNSKYCRPLWKEFNIHAIDNLTNMIEFEKMWYLMDDLNKISSKKADPKDTSRRHGANFHILMCEGHFEIRYHSGTLNANKILRWVELHQAIMKLAERSAESFVAIRLALEDMRFIQSLALRRKVFYNMLGLSVEARAYWEDRARKFTDDDKELAVHPENADI